MSRRHANAARAHFKATDRDVYITVPRVSRLTGIDRKILYGMIHRGVLKGEHVAGRLVVWKSSLDALPR